MLPKVAVITTSMKVRTGHQVGAATGGRHHDAREGRVGTRAGGSLPSSYYQGGLNNNIDDVFCTSELVGEGQNPITSFMSLP